MVLYCLRVKKVNFMKRLIITVCAGFGGILAMGFAFIALADAPVVKQDIVKTLPAPASQP